MTVPRWTCVQWIAAAAGAGAVLLAVGVPTGLVATPLFTRMTPAPWWSYAVWLATAAMSGMLIASYVRRAPAAAAPGQVGVLANVGSLLAVGCPVCNKVVVAVAGVGGALNVWAPLQPAVAAVSLLVLGWALRGRLSAQRPCPIPVTADPAGAPSWTGPRTRMGHDDAPR